MSETLRVALARVNPTIGDLDGNVALIERSIVAAREAGAGLVVFPELSITGYPPRDLLLQEGFVERAEALSRELGARSTRGITAVWGLPRRVGADARGRRLANALVAYADGRELAVYDKRLLPTYDVFDEDRYFTPGDRAVTIDVSTGAGGSTVRVGLSICEDLWRGRDVGFADRYMDRDDPVEALVRAGSRLIVNPSASPFRLGMGQRHRELLRSVAITHRVFVAGINQLGANDELVFDGMASVFDPAGRQIASGALFEGSLTLCEIDLARGDATLADPRAHQLADDTRDAVDTLASAEPERLLFGALVLGVRDYARKTGFTRALLGLSGGIDSAVVAVIACAALGPERVLGLSMPSRYSSAGSERDAHELARQLGMACERVPIEGAFVALLETLGPVFAGRAPDVAEENLQSRVRGTLLMGVSNKLGQLLLTTGNKSEMAVGYCTLYGDMNGGLAVLSDVTKQWVYRLARWMNAHWAELGIQGLSGAPVPRETIDKAPSAELRPNQTDQDSLPPYAVLDEIIERAVEGRESPEAIAGAMPGVDRATIARVLRLIDLSEYKRRQAAPGLKVTGVAFGTGRRMPIAQGWRPERGLK
jgi:NAD+ synthase (glutamine-hydrolysing)